MKSVGLRIIGCSLLLCAAGVFAESANDGMTWLAKMASAARQLNYAGTFVYRYGSFSESSRIRHLADEIGELEKIESLDGPVREIIRNKDEVWFYLPDIKTVKIDRAQTRRFFPALIADPVQSFSEGYGIKVLGKDRVAGRDCRLLALEPKDLFRYGYNLCADIESGLLLRASMVNGQNEVLEQFGFSDVKIGQFIPRDTLKSNFSNENWLRQNPPVVELSGWEVKELPPGFRKVMELKRRMASKADPVTHLLFSDGLAAVSVFVELRQGAPKATARPTQQGPVSYYSRQIPNYNIVVLGEVPAAAVLQIANSVFKP